MICGERVTVSSVCFEPTLKTTKNLVVTIEFLTTVRRALELATSPDLRLSDARFQLDLPQSKPETTAVSDMCLEQGSVRQRKMAAHMWRCQQEDEADMMPACTSYRFSVRAGLRTWRNHCANGGLMEEQIWQGIAKFVKETLDLSVDNL